MTRLKTISILGDRVTRPEEYSFNVPVSRFVAAPERYINALFSESPFSEE